MAKTKKDRPLVLRRRATGYNDAGEATGSVTHLDMDGWPPRHEFSHDSLLKLVSAGEAKVTDDSIELTFANARAVYRIVDSVELDGEPRTSHAGYWGELVEGKVD